MKTNKFEETIREKLEGVHSEFADGDWSSFQKFYKANTPAGFWKSYGSWLGYGSAAALFVAMSGICGLLYQQNVMLKKQVQEMMEIVSDQSAVTVDPSHASAGISEDSPDTVKTAEKPLRSKDPTVRGGQLPAEDDPGQKVGLRDRADAALAQAPETARGTKEDELKKMPPGQDRTVEKTGNLTAPAWPQSERAPAIHRETKTFLKELLPPALLADRTRAIRMKIPVTGFADKQTEVKTSVRKADANKAVEARKESRTLPTFVTNRPYRIGLSGSLTKDFYSYGAVNEFLVVPDISVTWGISRTVYKEMVFFNEKVFFDQTKQNFYKAFGKGVPLNGDIMNISTQSSLIQVPVFVNYRHTLGNGFYLTGSVGTHLNIRFRQSLGYDFWDGHKQIGISGLTYRKSTYPVINNFSPVLGVEKVLDPIVFQAEAFYHFQKGDIPYRNSVSGAGGRLKLLYQFGR